MANQIIEIDGGYLEGGGQIVRTATALASVTKKPCRVFNIRKSRPKPGLATQHLLGLQALANLSNAKLEGDFLGSEEIKFYPGEIKARDLHIKIGTAGSITLCLQSLLPVTLSSPTPIKISFDGGATDTFFSPSLDHFRHVFLKILEKMGPKVEIEILKRGYYPSGGGEVKVNIFPSKLKPLNLLERGNLKKILILSSASDLLKSKKIAERQLQGAKAILGKLKLPIETKIEYTSTDSPGSSICILCEFENTILGSDNLGKLGKPAEQVGKECASQILKEEKAKACLDRFLADQILIYMALSGGKNQVRISELTSHTQTNIWVIQQFLSGKFEIENNLIEWIPSTEK